MKIPLVKDTIIKKDLIELCEWMQQDPTPQFSQSTLVSKFEEEYSKYQGCKYSVFVNSGSSANLLMIYAMTLGKLKSSSIIVNSVCWSTTLSPLIQFGLKPVLCDVDKDTLGCDLIHLEHLMITQNPSILFLVNVLGFPNKMKEINALCEKYEIILLVDDCEDAGSEYDGKKTGTFGLMSTKSFFFSHLFSTVEGGLICTDDRLYYNTLKMLRAHGWSRNVDESFKYHLKKEYKVDKFNENFSFYIPGFNVRNTEIAAFLGLKQLERIEEFRINRKNNFEYFQNNIKNDYWKPNPVGSFVSNFAYPIITNKRDKLVKYLAKCNIDCRPLISGNMGLQPFMTDLYGKQNLLFADEVHYKGLYIPNHPSLTQEELKYICDSVNEGLK